MNECHFGDCRDVLRKMIADGVKVNCVITSPPYWGLRDYGTATWEGGDATHEHDTVAARNGRGGSGSPGKQTDSAYPSEFAAPVCKCGATRIDSQLGLEPTLAEFVANMVEVFSLVREVLTDDGVLFLNLGDSYAGRNGIGRNDADRDFTGGGGNKLGSGNPGRQGSQQRETGLKPKDLCGVPWRVALALQSAGCADIEALQVLDRVMAEISDAYSDAPMPDKVIEVYERLRGEWEQAKGTSWYLRQDLIWAKPNPMPESVTDRCTKAHEYVFILTKSARYFFDAEAIAEPALQEEFRPTFRGGAYVNNATYNNGVGGCSTDTGNVRISGATRNKRSVWTIPSQSFSESHFATFPEALVEPMVLAGTSAHGHCPECGKGWVRVVEKSGGTIGKSWHNHEDDLARGQRGGDNGNAAADAWGKGDYKVTTLGWEPSCAHNLAPVPGVVLDPFLGSGTTARVAQSLGRNWLGIELNEAYGKLQDGRITQQGFAFA